MYQVIILNEAGDVVEVRIMSKQELRKFEREAAERNIEFTVA